MKLSVIIVNYNVAYFLEQCLSSVRKAMYGLTCEVLVVDNNSIDDSVKIVREKFPWVKLISNKENTGFAKANNLAINESTGEYVLLLNPDTVIEEDTLKKVVSFMDEHPDAGGLGVKMIDGKGKFLPESKRALPTPQVAFYKIFGLSKLFPKSRRIGKYHLGYLDNDQTWEIEILSGAFMMLRKNALNQIGLLDEAFFMYGEDIDLSYRLLKAGWKNFYFPDTKIIHYKGESTKKTSINYVFVFYNAMVIFAKKHFSPKNAKLFSFLINLAIYLRAGSAILVQSLKKMILPITDWAMITVGLFTLKHFYLTITGKDFPKQLISIALPIYSLLWITSNFISGIYDKPIKALKSLKGTIIGTAIILIAYALLPEDYRFSRIIIIMGAGIVFIYYILSRLLLRIVGVSGYNLSNQNNKIILIGKKKESHRIKELLSLSGGEPHIIGTVHPSDHHKEDGYIGDISQIEAIIDINKVNEVIFCAKDLSSQQIISIMSKPDKKDIEYRIAQPESQFIIGSNSLQSPGDLYMLNVNAISKSGNKRNKRILDILASIVLLILFPFTICVARFSFKSISNLFQVLLGIKSLVGYAPVHEKPDFSLPRIKKGILFTTDQISNALATTEVTNKVNIIYAKDYHLYTDFQILWRGFKKLGR